jgi:hypothetical protein
VSEKFELIDAKKAALVAAGEKKYTITTMCTWLGVSTSGYWPPSAQPGDSSTKKRWHVHGAPRHQTAE